MKKTNLKSVFFGLAICSCLAYTLQSETAEAQTTIGITCPSGDSYTCYERTDSNGSSYSVKKGPGDSTHTIIVQGR